MKVRNVFGLMLSVVLLLVAAGSSLAREPQPTGPSEADGVNTAANAPWFNIDVDTPGNTGKYTSVAIELSSGKTYISYYDATNQALRMAVNVGSGGNCGPNNSWLCQTVDSDGDVGKYSSIAVNPQTGGIGIAYYDATNGKLKYAYCWSTPACSSGFSRETVDKGNYPVSNAGLYTSLKFAPNGRPIIAYYFDKLDPNGVDALKMAYHMFEPEQGNCGVDIFGFVNKEWQCDTIQEGKGVGQYASLALDGTGHVHIAYYDAANGDLWYATDRTGGFCGPGGTWLCYPVSVANDVGQYASLYVDNSNDFHIAYYDATIDKLKYAFDKGSEGNCGLLGSAQCDTIDDMMDSDYIPHGVSMAEFYAGYPIIAYQSKEGGLNVARPAAVVPGKILNCGPLSMSGYTWYCETINPPGTWIYYTNGDFVSIDLRSNGLATIAYYGGKWSNDGNLMVAYQQFQDFLPLVMKNQ
jgi:hypothetical protein